MGWLLMLGLTLGVGAALWPFVRHHRAALQLTAAALLVALAGYAWQGRPAMEGRPKPPPAQGAAPDSGFALLRGELLGRFDRASSWLTMAESYQRRGDTQGGVDIIRSGLRQDPRNSDLWIGLGYALVLHADGVMTPAAELAFRRAAQVAPEHPAPRFFYGLALVQGGRVEEAERVWRALLPDLPDAGGGEWRSLIEGRLRAIEQLRAMMEARTREQGPRPARTRR